MIKPKSRKHEDRIKALEERPYIGVAPFDRIYKDLVHLQNKVAETEKSLWWHKFALGAAITSAVVAYAMALYCFARI